MSNYRKLTIGATLSTAIVLIFFSSYVFGQPTCQYTTWQSHNLTQFTTGPTIWSDMIVEQGSPRGSRYDLIGRTGNRLSHYWGTQGTGWGGEDLTSIANNHMGGHRITGNPSFRQNFEQATLRHDVFAGDPFDLIHYWWTSQTGWRSENLSGNGHRILGDPIFVPGHQNGTLRHDVFAVNGSSELIHYWWTNQAGWGSENLTQSYGRPAMRSLRPTAVSFDRGHPLGYETHIFGRGDNNHLIHYWWNARQGWDAEDLTMQAGGPLITSDPEANYNTFSGGRLEVLATNSNGDIIRYWSFSTNVWDHDNLTLTLGGEPLVGKPVVLNAYYKDQGAWLAREDIWGRTSALEVVHYWSLDDRRQYYHGIQTWQPPVNLTTNFLVAHIYGNPAATVQNIGTAHLRYEVLAKTLGHLISSCWTVASGWQSESLTNQAGTRDTIFTDPVVTEDGRHVFARNRWGEVIHYWHENEETDLSRE